MEFNSGFKGLTFGEYITNLSHEHVEATPDCRYNKKNGKTHPLLQ